MYHSVHCIRQKCNQSLLYVKVNSLRVDRLFFSLLKAEWFWFMKKNRLCCTTFRDSLFSLVNRSNIVICDSNKVSKLMQVDITRIKLGLRAHRFC